MTSAHRDMMAKLEAGHTCIETEGPGRNQTGLHLNGIQMNPQKHSLSRRCENTLFGFRSEAKSTNVITH